MAAGIETRHARACRSLGGGRCNCSPTYRASVWDRSSGRLIRKRFDNLATAKGWHHDASVAVAKGTLRPPARTTVAEAAEGLLAGMADETVLDRSGKPYKPATRRKYKSVIDRYIVPALGDWPVSSVHRRDVQDLVDQLRARGLSPSSVHNAIDPLRVIFRRAVRRDEISVDPTDGLELPAVRGKRDRIEAPDHAERLIAALPEAQRALWTMAFFAGLRSGELRALRCNDLDLKAGVVNLKHGWDDEEGEIDVKSDAGCRTIPLAGVVRKELAAHLLREGRSGDDLVFGRTPTLPFVRSTVRARALRAWKAANDKMPEDAEPLRPLTPHEARHCAISYFIACGYDWKQATVFAGHSDVRTTYNRYAKVMPGGEEAAAAKLDTFLAGKTREMDAPIPAVLSGPQR